MNVSSQDLSRCIDTVAASRMDVSLYREVQVVHGLLVGVIVSSTIWIMMAAAMIAFS